MDERAPIELGADEFRAIGHRLVDDIAAFIDSVADRAVTPGEAPEDVRALIDGDAPLPENGTPPDALLRDTTQLLVDHSLLTGHPRFLGYVIGAAAPIGALADMLAAAVNPNVGAWALSPVATEIERQTVRWIAELVGYPVECGGLLVSGGNMANFVGFLAARRARAGADVQTDGLAAGRLRVYCSRETHTWIHKAADMFGLGTGAIRWIETDGDLRMDVTALRTAIATDRADGAQPFLVVGTGGSVSTGAIDPLPDLAQLCREEGLWFHVDGAYGAFAAALDDAPEELRGLADADSVALDPHKWLYAPAEAGCALVRDADELRATFDHTPAYYRFPEGLQYFKYGPQNSRGFRALKVWLALRQVGRDGYVRMIGDNIALARELEERLRGAGSFELGPCGLSISTFRYVPDGVDGDADYLNRLNEELLGRLQASGDVFLSNAVVGGQYLLRSCIVNFRTSRADIVAIPQIVARVGAEIHGQNKTLR